MGHWARACTSWLVRVPRGSAARLLAHDHTAARANSEMSTLVPPQLPQEKPTNRTTPQQKLSEKPPCPPFVTRGPAPSPRPVSSPAPLRAPPRNFSKGACPLALPPPRPVRGTGESVLARSQGNHSPKKRPLLHMNFDPRLGSPLPHPCTGNWAGIRARETIGGRNRREKEKGGKTRVPLQVVLLHGPYARVLGPPPTRKGS